MENHTRPPKQIISHEEYVENLSKIQNITERIQRDINKRYIKRMKSYIKFLELLVEDSSMFDLDYLKKNLLSVRLCNGRLESDLHAMGVYLEQNQNYENSSSIRVEAPLSR